MADTGERLRAVDSIWLDADHVGPPIAIGSLTTGEGPAPTLDEVKDLIRARMAGMPRLRQRVVPSATRVKRPTWEEVESLDLDLHVRSYAVDEPGDRDALDRAVSRIMEVPLDPGRPLWDLHLLTGVGASGEGGDPGWATVTRMHHAVADGQGAVLLLGRMIDTDPDGGATLTDALDAFMKAMAGAGRAPVDEAREGPRDQLVAAAARGGDFVLRALRKGVSAEEATSVVESVKEKAATAGLAAAEAISKGGEALSTAKAGKPGSMSGPPGATRTWVSVTVPLSDVKAIRKALGGTINDVVMTLMSGGFRHLLAERGEDVDSRIARVLIPVSLRMPGDLAANNQVSGLIVLLPLGGDEPTRLREINAHIGVLKDVGAVGVGKIMFDLNQALPAAAQSLIVRTFDQLPAVLMETLVTNVPGPQFPVYFAGRRVTSMTPIIPLGGFLRLSTGILSYDGTLNFGISGGADAGEDALLVREGIAQAHRNLMAAAGA